LYIKFFGVRGSLPAPVTPDQIQAKISAVLERLTPQDIENEDTKTKFLSNLPKWLFGTTGGNTPCVEVRSKNGTEFIMDSGTGIRLLGKELPATKNNTYHLFLSHYHWDHIQGFPFF
jgi:glyoxylase-like metal-dependent hydrolase (beta-lactamase superfamily II)